MNAARALLVVLAACHGAPQATRYEGPALDPLGDRPPAAPPPEPPSAAAEANGKGRLTARPHPPRASARVGRGGYLALGLGGERDGGVYVPSGYDPSRPTPLLVLFHGAGGSAERISRRFRERAEQAGTILLAIDSRDRTWDIVSLRHFGPDVPFIDHALASAFDRWNIDPARVAVGGFSDGASYALSVGLTNGDLFSRVLAFSPGFMAPGEPIGKPQLFVSHGTEDQILDVGVSRKLVPLLQRAGYDVKYVEFPDDHKVPDDVLDAAFAWMASASL